MLCYLPDKRVWQGMYVYGNGVSEQEESRDLICGLWDGSAGEIRVRYTVFYGRSLIIYGFNSLQLAA